LLAIYYVKKKNISCKRRQKLIKYNGMIIFK